jgi:hypothetical protein
MKKNVLLALAAVVLVACGQKSERSYKPVQLHGAITHVQPMTGLVLWSDPAAAMNATHGSSIALEFSYIQPCLLVTGKQDGVLQYDWTYLEDKLSAAASRGHQMVLRFPLCYPSNRNNCIGKKGGTYVPAYIRALPNYKETYAANPGGDGPTWYPDWSNSELQWFVKQFYSDLAERYNNDARVAFIEVGFGHWGEGHTYGTKPLFGVNFPAREYQRELFIHLSQVMTIPWLTSIDAGDEYYSDICTHEDTRNLAFGLFDDTFMHAEHELSKGDGWNEKCWQWSGMDHWKTGVCGGEISYYTPDDQHNFLNPNGMYGFTWEQAAAKYHMTFVICNDAMHGAYFSPERATEAGIASGYKFKILACETNGKESRIRLVNNGIAPIYRDAYVTVNNVRAEQSLRGLLPGEEQTYIVKAPATSTNVRITSDFILPSQEIEFESGN